MTDNLRHILKRTTTEEFEYDRDKLLSVYRDDLHAFHIKREAERERFGHTPLRDDEVEDEFLIELFEKHNGSLFCDESLFSSTASDDYGIELVTRGEDD